MKQTHVWTLRALRYPVYLMARNQYLSTGLVEQVHLSTCFFLASNGINSEFDKHIIKSETIIPTPTPQN